MQTILAKATGRPREVEQDRARQQLAELLPAGMGTDGTWILLIVDEAGVKVGTVWVGPHPERAGVALLYDLEIVHERRGLGVGSAAMMAVGSLVKEAGGTEIGLSVFGFNEPARHLYDSPGFRVVSTLMTKTIEAKLPGGSPNSSAHPTERTGPPLPRAARLRHSRSCCGANPLRRAQPVRLAGLVRSYGRFEG